MEEKFDNDIAKELLMVISSLDKDFVNTIPNIYLEKLSKMAADSDKNYYFDPNKPLNRQNLSSSCLNALALLYYEGQNDEEKKEILSSWLFNDQKN